MRAVIRAYRTAFSGLPLETWQLSSVALINRAGTMVIPFLVLYLTEERGFSAKLAGLYLALYGVGSVVGANVGGWLTDRLGPHRVEALSLTVGGLLFFVLGRQEGPISIAVTLFLLSVGAESFRPANVAHVAATCAPAQRTKAMALNRLAINAGMAIGPTVGGFLAERSFQWLFIVDGATCLIAASLFVVLLRPRPRPTDGSAVSTAMDGISPWKDTVFLTCLLLCFCVCAVYIQMYATVPLYLTDAYGFSKDRIGLLFAINPVLIIALEMLLVHRLQRENPLRWVGVGSFLACLGISLFPFGDGIAFAALAVVVTSVGEMLESPLLGGFVTTRVAEKTRGRAMGLYMMTFSLAVVLGPMIGTAVYDQIGPRPLFLGCGGVGALLLVVYLMLARRVDRERAVTAVLTPSRDRAPKSGG